MRPIKRFDGTSKWNPQPKPPPKPKEKKNPIKSKSGSDFSIKIRVADDALRNWKIKQAGTKLVKCCTCPVKLPAKQLQLGHFLSRRLYAVRWEEENTELQCSDCNCLHHGRPDEFAEHIEKKYGKGTVERLIQLSKQPFKLEREFLNEVINKYK